MWRQENKLQAKGMKKLEITNAADRGSLGYNQEKDCCLCRSREIRWQYINLK